MLFHSSRGDVGAPARGRARLTHGWQARAADADGFTLIELLVVVLIIGVLAAIAIPAFVGQKAKAVDAQAKELVRSAETAAEGLATDNSGAYSEVSPAAINSYEPSVRIAPSSTEAYLSAASGGEDNYSLVATATNGDEFTIAKSSAGVTTRLCVSPVSKTGCSGGEEASW